MKNQIEQLEDDIRQQGIDLKKIIAQKIDDYRIELTISYCVNKDKFSLPITLGSRMHGELGNDENLKRLFSIGAKSFIRAYAGNHLVKNV